MLINSMLVCCGKDKNVSDNLQESILSKNISNKISNQRQFLFQLDLVL